MPFITKHINEQDIEEFQLIKTNEQSETSIVAGYLTVDRERKIHLRVVGFDKIKRENVLYSYVWKGLELLVAIRSVVERVNGVTIVTSEWEDVRGLEKPDALKCFQDNNTEIISDFKEALSSNYSNRPNEEQVIRNYNF